MKTKNKVALFLIAGGTASGKTTIAKEIAESLTKYRKLKVNVVEIDNYYHEITHWGNKTEHQINWDEPSAINWDLLEQDITKMLNSEKVVKAKFDYATNMYFKNKNVVYDKADLIIVEGLFAMWNEKLLAKANFKMYVDTDADIRLIRRVERDIERHPNFDPKVFMKTWIKTIKPMHDKWVEPQKATANVIIQNNHEMTKVFDVLTHFFPTRIK